MEQTQYNELKAGIDEIRTALIGNAISKDGGLVGKVSALDETVQELKSFKDRSKWTASLLIGFAGVLGWLADKIFDLFTKN